MPAPSEEFTYVGPDDIRAAVVRPGATGRAVRSPEGLREWLDGAGPADRGEPFTYVVDPAGTLLLAPRRSEHVACAEGGPVLAAGEITFAPREDGGWEVTEVSNQSTGYCPDPAASWPALAEALDRAGLARPRWFTQAVVFRHCPRCGERNLVKDGDFTCALCESPLPPRPVR
ncbi:hypothetical protein OG539_13985 [Actinacidiphila glaucinigra]|uniref:hypothetical protein n=1 Tax=Actinacidiphila glaucinigra TaxID=235986 RepID=UPI0032430694